MWPRAPGLPATGASGPVVDTVPAPLAAVVPCARGMTVHTYVLAPAGAPLP